MMHKISRTCLGLSVTRRSFSSIGKKSNLEVIELWRRVLAGVHAPGDDQHHDQSFKELVATGISLNRGRHQNFLPDELIANFRSYYSTLDVENKHRLFHSLATVFSIDKNQIDEAVEHWRSLRSRTESTKNNLTGTTASASPTSSVFASPSSSDDEASLRAAERLYQSTQPLYSRLWTPLAQHHDGLSFLIDLRGDLLKCISAHPGGAGALRLMSESLRRTLAGWFNVGLLQVERVTWENTPAAMLEKIANEEKVHSISDLNVLKSRLGEKRRVFAWMHPSLPGQPLVALHVALCSSITSSMDEILKKRHGNMNSTSTISKESDDSPTGTAAAPTVAIFYSINNMKRGLTGVDLGNNLIKRAAKELLIEIPSLKTLSTLSPLPGFASWVESTLTRVEGGGKLNGVEILLPEEKEKLIIAFKKDRKEENLETEATHVLLKRALTIFNSSPSMQTALKAPLLRLAAHYLLNEKHRGRSLNSVANFHLRNGASLYRLNWLADTSRAGFDRSYGVMVNYMYAMDAVEENNRKYIVAGEISVSKEVEKLLDNTC
jgi:Malonyl-CoA decarboxylase C-terminal domain/Malonyl-CoA decarboxylase N-terminal domain